ncbi:50S ribosomal protein L12 [archaeon]|nr:50S ribosomal protein L12 [archaeon]
MEYVYSALLLHKIGKDINEENVKHLLQGAGAQVDDAKIKALTTALDGVNIEEALKEAAVVPTAAPAEAKKEEVKEEPKVDENKAAAGLGSLFG